MINAMRQMYPPVVLPGQWRPNSSVALALGRGKSQSLPSFRKPGAKLLLGQAALTSKETATELMLSTTTAIGAVIAGFGVAFMAPKQANTWKWIGAISGTVGLLKLLQTASKLA